MLLSNLAARVGLGVAAVSALAACPATPPVFGTTDPGNPGLVLLTGGSPAPAASFLDENDQQHTLAEFKGKDVVLLCFAYWCPHCQDDAPQFQAFADQHPKATFVPVESSGGKKADVLDFKSKYGLKGTVYYDPTKQFLAAMAVTAYPTSMIVGSDGTIVAREVGLPNLTLWGTMLGGP